MKIIDASKVTNKKEIIPNEDSVKISYYEDGHPLKSYELTGKLATHCAGLQLIIKDLDLVNSTLTLASDHLSKLVARGSYNEFNTSDNDHIILSSLITSSIVTYCKHFTNGYGVAPYIQEKTIIDKIGSDEILLHRKIMDLRNNWIAHGGINSHEVAKTILVIDFERSQSINYLHHVCFFPTLNVKEIKGFLCLSQNITSIIRTMLRESSKALLRSEIEPISLEEHYNRSNDGIIFSNHKPPGNTATTSPRKQGRKRR